MLPRHARCVLSRLRCIGHSLLLSSYLFRIGRIENPSYSACGHPSQDISHLILHCPATDSLHRSLFGDSLSLYDLWSRPWGIARLLGLHGFPPCRPSLGRGRVEQQPPHTIRRLNFKNEIKADIGPNNSIETRQIQIVKKIYFANHSSGLYNPWFGKRCTKMSMFRLALELQLLLAQHYLTKTRETWRKMSFNLLTT